MRINLSIWSRTTITVLMLSLVLAATQRVYGEDHGNSSNRNAAELFAVLPDGASGPEGLTLGPDGNVYVATFGFNAAGSVTGLGQLYVFNREGKLLRNVKRAEFIAASAGNCIPSSDRGFAGC